MNQSTISLLDIKLNSPTIPWIIKNKSPMIKIKNIGAEIPLEFLDLINIINWGIVYMLMQRDAITPNMNDVISSVFISVNIINQSFQRYNLLSFYF